MYATPHYSLYTSSFKKLDLIEVNESMKLKGSEMGTKMQKIESRSQLASSIAARSSKRENFGKLQQAVGPGDRLTTPICGQHSTTTHYTQQQQQYGRAGSSFSDSQLQLALCLLLSERTSGRGRPASAFLTTSTAAASQPIESVERKKVFIRLHKVTG